MIRSSSLGAAWEIAGDYHAAPMGLKTVLFGRWYSKHVALTELATQLPAVAAPSLASQSCDAKRLLLLPLQGICNMEIGC